MIYGPYDWDQFDSIKSRFTDKPIFVVQIPEPAGGDWITPEEMQQLAAEAQGVGVVPVAPFGIAVGRGASGSAIGLLIDLGVNLSAAAIVGAVVAVWKRLQHRRPIMSVGALRYLCMADLVDRLAVDSMDDIVTVVACDTSGPRPSELNPVDLSRFLLCSPTA